VLLGCAATQAVNKVAVPDGCVQSVLSTNRSEAYNTFSCWLIRAQVRRASAWMPCIDAPSAAVRFQLDITCRADEVWWTAGAPL
jgi:hypothetical protein